LVFVGASAFVVWMLQLATRGPSGTARQFSNA